MGVEIEKVETNAMLHLALTQIMQTQRPLPVWRQIVRHAFREEDVSGIAAIHYPARHVDSGAGNIGPPTHISHLAHRSAVNSHADRNLRVLFERFGNLE